MGAKIQQLTELHDRAEPGLLQAYVDRTKQDGEEKTRLQLNLLNAMVQGDREIVELLRKYKPHELTANFRDQSNLFLGHANSYIVCFESLGSLVKANQDLPKIEKFPEGFPSAPSEEIRARRVKAGLSAS